MFEQTFINPRAETRRPWTVAASLTLQTGLVGTVLLLPLLHPGTITPHFNFDTPLVLTKLAPPPPPEFQPALTAAPRRSNIFINPLVPSRTVPRTIDMSPDPAPELLSPFVASIAASLNEFAAVHPVPPPPPPVPAARVTQPPAPLLPIRRGGDVQAALLLAAPKPAYPALAKAARVQGTVRMEALIVRDGTIRNLHVTSGPPLLVKAALDAVAQWRYRPTTLNGETVEVLTQIDVNFALN